MKLTLKEKCRRDYVDVQKTPDVIVKIWDAKCILASDQEVKWHIVAAIYAVVNIKHWVRFIEYSQSRIVFALSINSDILPPHTDFDIQKMACSNKN